MTELKILLELSRIVPRELWPEVRHEIFSDIHAIENIAFRYGYKIPRVNKENTRGKS